MRIRIVAMVFVVGSIMTGCRIVEVKTAPRAHYQGPAYQRTAVCYLEEDVEKRREFERAFRDALAVYQVKPESCADLFDKVKTPDVASLKALLQSEKMDSLLLIEPRETIQLDPPASATASGSALTTALKTYLTGPKASTTETLDMAIKVPTGRNRIEEDVIRGNLRVIDVTSGARVWGSDAHVKVAVNMRDSDRARLISEAAAAQLSEQGLVPPKKP